MNWSVRSDYEQEINKEEEKKKEEVKKVRVNYLINKNYSQQFKDLCNRKGWIMSAVIEHSIKRHLGI
tara:strand:+ start:298 stop:498 length:201 start_codon:yes stop_codon:yes gene_type:complete